MPKASDEVWELRVAKRRNAVAGVKASREYREFYQRFDSSAGVAAPRTPDPACRATSKRNWEKDVSIWRATLRGDEVADTVVGEMAGRPPSGEEWVNCECPLAYGHYCGVMLPWDIGPVGNRCAACSGATETCSCACPRCRRFWPGNTDMPSNMAATAGDPPRPVAQPSCDTTSIQSTEDSDDQVGQIRRAVLSHRGNVAPTVLAAPNLAEAVPEAVAATWEDIQQFIREADAEQAAATIGIAPREIAPYLVKGFLSRPGPPRSARSDCQFHLVEIGTKAFRGPPLQTS